MFALGLITSALVGGCQEDPAVRACLAENGRQDDCGTACNINQSEEACGKWKQMTVELCDKAGKRTCESICRGDGNPFACEKARSM